MFIFAKIRPVHMKITHKNAHTEMDKSYNSKTHPQMDKPSAIGEIFQIFLKTTKCVRIMVKVSGGIIEMLNI